LLLKKATNLIFPSVCVSCECIIDENLNLCSECNKKINFLTKHYCNVCGVVISDNIYTCGKCIINPPPFIALFTIIRTDHNMLLLYHSHKHISYPIRTIARSAILYRGGISAANKQRDDSNLRHTAIHSRYLLAANT
ncbi:double zinc ribbon domain-containing protein, partial [Wolbachia endosymbiont of Drosophila bicornuta]